MVFFIYISLLNETLIGIIKLINRDVDMYLDGHIYRTAVRDGKEKNRRMLTITIVPTINISEL
jgi:hypothetical protein